MCTLRPLLTGLIVLFFTLTVRAQDKEEPVNSGAILEKCSKLYEDGAYTKAIELYKTVSRNDTNYSTILHELAYASYMDSDYEKSISYAKQGLAEFPEKSGDWYNLIGNTLDITGKRKEAVVYYDSLLLINPNSYLGWYNKGIAYSNMENYADAKKCLQKALLIYPFHTSSHYFLGVIAAKEGNIVPAMLSFSTCLLMNPESKYSGSCVTFLNNIAKVTDDIAEKIGTTKISTDDDFELQQEIILSKAALDKKYKLQTDLEDPITRQLQVMLEKLEYNAADNGFSMQYYVPFYTDLYKNGQFNIFLNYIFSGLDIKSVKSFNQKNDKKIYAFVKSATDYFSAIRRTEKLQYTARMANTQQYYFSDGSLLGIGNWHNNGKEDIFTGPWVFYYENGLVKSKGNFDDNGEKTGDWEFYFDNGKLKQKCSFINGMLEGKVTTWFSNGNISDENIYVHDKLNGENKTYFYNGLLQTINHYIDDKREGEEKGYTYDGFLNYTATYKNDELEGTVNVYHNNGKTSLIKNYSNGKLNGAYKTFSSNGVLTMEGTYDQDKLSGQWKEYYDSKALKSEYSYNNGSINGLYKSYHENGKLSETLQYANGKADGKEEGFDEDGIKYSESIYENGKLRELTFFDKKGQTVNSFTTRKGAGNLAFYDAFGTKDNEASFNKEGYRDGKSTYYFPSGKISTEANYKEGSLDGERTIYFANGQISEKMNFTDNEENGMLRSFHINGNLKFTGYFKSGRREGEHISYNQFGTPVVSYYYLNNDQDGYTTYYSANGKKDYEEQYYRGWLKKAVQYDTLGNVLAVSDFPGGTGELIYKHYNGKVYIKASYKNYMTQGKYEAFYFDGAPRMTLFYKNGYKDSIAKTYYYNGKLQNEGRYTLGEKTGEWKYYYENGTINYTENYVDGKEQGEEILYKEDGTKDRILTYNKGQLDGTYIVYGDNNEIAIQLTYHNDVLINYTYYGKDGKLVTPIPVKNGTAMVTAYYKNGNKSAEVNYENSDVNGVRKFYYTSGAPYIDGARLYGYDNGIRKTYYTNNRLAKEENYYYDNLHGTVKSYYPNGNIKAEENWYNGELNGASKYYDETGKLKETRTYYYDLLLSVSKN
ncbi:tetratricopeptide repeat protein [Panacibacter ginsenosidivorans]|uniref:Tetratricopeptide repeat protein n=1 Tax=Panacibacter ginsenosidivorans TaxID=1813871 RepID=A0A5B8VCJ6_9BACT|nr:tetratricopeptide repeat protein [Panacibacter ginsenosidivorans]QEC68406.1 tetratricopeptide repeat protein [Panacibacter ginsenosidivorans]